MSELKYTVIKDDEQYYKYCDRLEELVSSGLKSEDAVDEYDLLYLLIKTWDDKHRSIPELDPAQFIKSLMEDHGLKQADLVEIAGVGKSTISEFLNYKKRMSKKVIRNLANHFKIQQEALNKPYRLEGEGLTNDFESKFSPKIEAKVGNTVSYDELIEGVKIEEPKLKIYKPKSGMSKEQNAQITFGLYSFKILVFELNEDVVDYDEENSGYSFQFRLETSKKDSTVSFLTKITAQEGENADKIIARIETRTTFHISEIDKITDGESLNLPNNLGVTLLSISLSTTRGAFAAKTEGHFLENHLIPLVNPQMMYEEFLKSLEDNRNQT